MSVGGFVGLSVGGCVGMSVGGCVGTSVGGCVDMSAKPFNQPELSFSLIFRRF